MSIDKKRVLVVDDSTDDIHILIENLKPLYAVQVATNGKQALEVALKKPNPDVILMDVEMPEMDGYASCSLLKETSETADIDVIFVSAHEDINEKLAGYEAGGSDYLIKPVNTEELMQKVALAIENKQERISASEQTEMANTTAMAALFSVGEQGIVLDFMRQSYRVKNVVALGELLVSACKNYQLDACVQIGSINSSVNLSGVGFVTPLEEELLDVLRGTRVIQEQGKRLVANYEGTSLIVKNMPDDDEKRGRLRDHVAMLLEGAEARALALEMEVKIKKMLQDSNLALGSIKEMQDQQSNMSVEMLDAMKSNVEEAFAETEFTEDQENLIMDIIDGSIAAALKSRGVGDEIGERLVTVLKHMLTHINE